MLKAFLSFPFYLYLSVCLSVCWLVNYALSRSRRSTASTTESHSTQYTSKLCCYTSERPPSSADVGLQLRKDRYSGLGTDHNFVQELVSVGRNITLELVVFTSHASRRGRNRSFMMCLWYRGETFIPFGRVKNTFRRVFKVPRVQQRILTTGCLTCVFQLSLSTRA